MLAHRWRMPAFPRRDRRRQHAIPFIVAVALMAAALDGAAIAAPKRPTIPAEASEEIDTEDMFGFVEGSDIGEAGKQELEADATLRAGKNPGTYSSGAAELEYKYTAFANFRISGLATLAYYDITGVAGLNDQKSAAVQSLSLDARFRLLDRRQSPFGLTLSVGPHWGFADETSGVKLNHIGWEALLLADRELVANRVFGAANLLFNTDRTRLLPNREIEQAPTTGIGAALAMRFFPGIWLGAETRYLRSYEGASLNVLSGQALYVGPTFYTRIGKQGWLSAAFSAQVWGDAVGVPGALDLANFERYQVKLRAGYEF
jgi:hypothetical protein